MGVATHEDGLISYVFYCLKKGAAIMGQNRQRVLRGLTRTQRNSFRRQSLGLNPSSGGNGG